MNSRNKWLLGAVTAATISAVAIHEGISTDPYEDIVGVATVCYGETNVEMRRYTLAECKVMLGKSLVKYGDGVLACLNVPINQNQHGAFTSFAYNVGVGAFCGSSVARRLNAGDYAGACDAMMAWDMAGGKHVMGLRTRRAAERKLCLTPVKEPA